MTSIKSLLLSANQKQFFSLEFTPKDTFVDVDLDQLPALPLFVSTTWLSDDNLKYESVDKSPSLIMTKNLMAKNVPVLTHLSCYKLTEVDLDEILKVAHNVFPLKGDTSAEGQRFTSSLELIREIRAKKDVTIFSSAYPQKCLEDEKREMLILKEKISNGADAIITQVVYDSDLFTKFVDICRKNNVNIPIMCGIFGPSTFAGLKRMEELTREKLPENLMNEYRMFENDEDLFKAFSVETTAKLVQNIFQENKNKGIVGVHFFTMNNLEQVGRVLGQLEFEYTKHS